MNVEQITGVVLQGGKHLTFKLGVELYGVEISQVQEIIKPPTITRVPCQPPFIRGVINLRGRIIPVVDLRLRFGMDGKENDELTCVVVMQLADDKGGMDMGIIVDEVQEVVDIELGQIEPAPEFGSEVDTGFMSGMAKLEDRVVMLLDAERALSLQS